MFSRLIVVLAASLLAVGCAHQQKPVEVAQTPKPVAPAPRVSVPAEDVDLAAQQAARDLDALLKGLVVHFEFDRYELSSDSRARLDKLADTMRKLPQARLRISGHADDRGTEEYNLALGHKRAEIAREYLIKLGVTDAHVETVSYGDEVPLVQASNEAAWAQNRRDEFARLTSN